MGKTLRILIVEDSQDDALLVVQELRRSGYEPSFERVDQGPALRAALGAGRWDVVIADYSMPHFSGLAAIAIVREAGFDVPVIVVSGAIGEETAVAAMRAGANDYVMKDRLARLGPAVERELRETEERRGRRVAEAALHKTEQELSEAQRELMQSEKLAALGRFSSGIAHEVKNPLGIILGGTEFLANRLAKSDEDVKTAITKVREAALRAASILDEMLKFARPSELKLQPMDPNEVVKDALSLFQYGIGSRKVELKTTFAPGSLRIRVDRNQIQQVLFNLLANAVEAVPDGGFVRTTVSEVPAGRSPLKKRSCAIEIADAGVGISRENLPRVFEPFFSTKRDTKGTGLGLSVARTIVDHHGGSLRMASTPGKGTTATITLSLAEGP